jgi:glycosyltransferase involved in cell wall biosynthesis
MNLKPLISVIIPVYNSEKYLAEAIESVLSQADCNLDVIVVDDGSTDNTAKVVDSFGSQVRYNYRMNGGPAAARNHGIALARGDFFAFLDADDLWTADKMKRQWMAFEADPELEMAFGHVRQFYSPDLSEEEKVKINIPVEIIPGHLPSTMLIKKKSFFRVGIFKEELKIGDFIDWYARAVDLNLKSIMLRDAVLERRIHSTNMGITHRNQRSGYVHALKAALDRRRAKG